MTSCSGNMFKGLIFSKRVRYSAFWCILAVLCFFLGWRIGTRSTPIRYIQDGSGDKWIGTADGTMWKVCDWPHVRDWMASCDRCNWERYRFQRDDGFDSFVVSFSPNFSCSSMGTSVVGGAGYLTIFCVNSSDSILDVKGFPTCVKGVWLEGRFDLSDANIVDSVKYFYWDSSGYSSWNYVDALPKFGEASRLTTLELRFGDIYTEERGCVPSLDLERYTGLGNLRYVIVSAKCPILNLPRFLDNSRLRYVLIEMSFDRADYFGLTDGSTDNSTCDGCCDGVKGNMNCHITDSTFDDFLQMDFCEATIVNLTIKLDQPRRFSVCKFTDGLAKRKSIKIIAKNCIIDDLERIADFRNIEFIDVSMEFEAGNE